MIKEGKIGTYFDQAGMERNNIPETLENYVYIQIYN